ncbi:FtsX-like permease family protein [Pseudoflavitalea sp. G-6-1-2]|uniref:ABC transporter permease n=1 Tax=Pseudoflavitalea sp. G-6-1-2 TaxID=2728841 RepID=UPI00146C3B87|nr:ABC transporter permease [Pseudoflavitalea sp. G-6-1-2]NML19547.1 FtsX-like permease family protein [Pseudoflavitalea sp. G-6-1-2]
MFKTNLRIAWRNIIKHRFHSLVNIAGLFAGITFALLITAYVWQELQVNKQLSNADRQYILQTHSKDPNLGNDLTSFGPIAKRLKEEYPHLVKNFYRFDGISSQLSKGDKHFRESIQVGDSTILTMYGFKMLHGDAATALNNPFSIVIPEEKAIKYFGRTDVVGESITVRNFSGDKREFQITAVMKEPSENSVTNLTDDQLNFLTGFSSVAWFGRMDVESWQNIYVPSFVELQEGVDPKSLQGPLDQLIRSNAPAVLQQNLSVTPIQLSKYYLGKNNGLVSRMLYTLSIAGLFILLMAIVNFVNISISRSGTRMKEIGVRKVLGGMKKQLVMQFLSEAFILVLVSTLMAIAGYAMMRPLFSSIVGKELPELMAFPSWFVLIPLIISVAVGFMAGVYPALVLSSMKTIESLKGKLKSVKENILLRRSLVGFQFGIALIVLVAAGIITQQVAYFFGRELGYNKEFVVSSQVPRDWTPQGVERMATVRNELANLPGVKEVSLSYEIPNGNNGGSSAVFRLGADSTQAIALQNLITDEHYLTTYQIPVKAGQYFNSADSGKVVLNETAAKMLGWKNAEEAIGQQLRMAGDPTVFSVKGVTADFYIGSMQQKMQPVVYLNVDAVPIYRFFSLKLQPGNTKETIRSIENKWAELLPGSSFEFSFMDEALQRIYANEIRMKKAAYTATALCLLIVLLGVLGLVAMNVQKRIREIGIRKVLGASVPGIIMLFVKEFLLIITITALVACPLAWFIMNQWLNNYAARVSITLNPFIVSMMALGGVTLLLIVLYTARTALMNPAKSLKAE